MLIEGILNHSIWAWTGLPCSWLADYDKDNLTIGVVGGFHSSLQILHGARKEGFRTLGIAVGENRRKIYQAFPGADPDEWLIEDCPRNARLR